MAGEAIKNIRVILFQSVILNHFKSDNYFLVGEVNNDFFH
jgi:hypothetical protein